MGCSNYVERQCLFLLCMNQTVLLNVSAELAPKCVFHVACFGVCVCVCVCVCGTNEAVCVRYRAFSKYLKITRITQHKKAASVCERHVKVLEQHMLPSRRCLFQRCPCFFQQDNAKTHPPCVTTLWPCS